MQHLISTEENASRDVDAGQTRNMAAVLTDPFRMIKLATENDCDCFVRVIAFALLLGLLAIS